MRRSIFEVWIDAGGAAKDQKKAKKNIVFPIRETCLVLQRRFFKRFTTAAVVR